MSALDPAELAAWKQAIGNTETRHEQVELESLRRYALALDGNPGIETVLPPLPHWACFLPRPQDNEIGVDGHPRRGGFLPAITLPRRMFAAADIVFEAPLVLGGDAELVSTVAEVTHKSGKSGDLVFVEVDRVLRQGGAVRVRERQSYVYRGMGDPVPSPTPAETLAEGEAWTPGPVNLFRFSAATFNGHRIHYDSHYARAEEGYPGLVVQGPFTAAKLAALAARQGPLRRFAFRAQAPLFEGRPIVLRQEGDEVRAIRCDGATAMTANVEYQ